MDWRRAYLALYFLFCLEWIVGQAYLLDLEVNERASHYAQIATDYLSRPEPIQDLHRPIAPLFLFLTALLVKTGLNVHVAIKALSTASLFGLIIIVFLLYRRMKVTLAGIGFGILMSFSPESVFAIGVETYLFSFLVVLSFWLQMERRIGSATLFATLAFLVWWQGIFVLLAVLLLTLIETPDLFFEKHRLISYAIVVIILLSWFIFASQRFSSVWPVGGYRLQESGFQQGTYQFFFWRLEGLPWLNARWKSLLLVLAVTGLLYALIKRRRAFIVAGIFLTVAFTHYVADIPVRWEPFQYTTLMIGTLLLIALGIQGSTHLFQLHKPNRQAMQIVLAGFLTIVCLGIMRKHIWAGDFTTYQQEWAMLARDVTNWVTDNLTPQPVLDVTQMGYFNHSKLHLRDLGGIGSSTPFQNRNVDALKPEAITWPYIVSDTVKIDFEQFGDLLAPVYKSKLNVRFGRVVAIAPNDPCTPLYRKGNPRFTWLEILNDNLFQRLTVSADEKQADENHSLSFEFINRTKYTRKANYFVFRMQIEGLKSLPVPDYEKWPKMIEEPWGLDIDKHRQVVQQDLIQCRLDYRFPLAAGTYQVWCQLYLPFSETEQPSMEWQLKLNEQNSISFIVSDKRFMLIPRFCYLGEITVGENGLCRLVATARGNEARYAFNSNQYLRFIPTSEKPVTKQNLRYSFEKRMWGEIQQKPLQTTRKVINLMNKDDGEIVGLTQYLGCAFLSRSHIWTVETPVIVE